MQIPHRKLFIPGDLLDGDNPIPKNQQPIVAQIRREKRDTFFFYGNHDPREKGLIRKRLGMRVKTYRRFTYKRGGRRIYVFHGDEFDDTKFLFNWPRADRLFSRFIKYLNMVQIWGIGLNLLVHWPHKRHAWKIKKKILQHAKFVHERKKKRKKKNHIIICGHTHFPDHEIVTHEDGSQVEYFNCGGPGNLAFVTVDENGNGKLHLVNEYSLPTIQ